MYTFKTSSCLRFSFICGLSLERQENPNGTDYYENQKGTVYHLHQHICRTCCKRTASHIQRNHHLSPGKYSLPYGTCSPKKRISLTFISKGRKSWKEQKDKSNCLNRIWPISHLIYLSVPRNYLCGAQSSPFRKFTDTPEGVGHRHKLPKLVEESNILIFAISETHRPSRSQQSCVIVTQTTEFGRDWAAM